MEWYYAKHGKQEGPVDQATLQGKLQSGELAPTDLVWHEGMAEWKAAGDVSELIAAPQAAVVPAGQGHRERRPVRWLRPGLRRGSPWRTPTFRTILFRRFW